MMSIGVLTFLDICIEDASFSPVQAPVNLP